MKAASIEPMLLERCSTLPQSDAWLIELKLDGFRAIGFKSGGKVYLRSRNDKDFSSRYPDVVKSLAEMPYETLIDGEIVAFDAEGSHPSTLSRTTAPQTPSSTTFST